LIEEKYSMFKMFVTVDSINASNLLVSQTISIRLEHSKFLTIFFKLRVTMDRLQVQHSFV